MGLAGTTFLVYTQVFSFCKDTSGSFWESRRGTAEFLGMSERQVNRDFRQLEDDRLIRCVGEWRLPNGRVTKRYEAMLLTIYTSQYSLESLQERMFRAHETETVKAIVSRIRETSLDIRLYGRDLRVAPVAHVPRQPPPQSWGDSVTQPDVLVQTTPGGPYPASNTQRGESSR